MRIKLEYQWYLDSNLEPTEIPIGAIGFILLLTSSLNLIFLSMLFLHIEQIIPILGVSNSSIIHFKALKNIEH